MKNDDLIYDWLDYVALQKSHKKNVIKEDIIKVDNDLRREPRSGKIEGIVIHHTHTRSAKSTLSVLLQRNFSTNYEVDQQGNVYEYLNPDQYKAIATGGGANEHTVAIDVTHFGNEPFPDIQIQALKKLVNDLSKKYGFQLKLAPDLGPKNWNEWQKSGKKYTLFRHRNFVATGCPMNLPMEKLLSNDNIITKSDDVEDVLAKTYSYIKDLGTSAYDKAKDFGSDISTGIDSLISESLDQKIFKINDESKDKIYTKYQKYFDSLLVFLKKELKLTKPVKINFLNDKKNANEVLGKTGSYINHKKEIVIYTTGRHIKDVMRSLAHELVHHRQNIRGEFIDHEPTKHGYAQSNKHLRKMEKEAYLKGNIHFRDWEDNYKYRGEK